MNSTNAPSPDVAGLIEAAADDEPLVSIPGVDGQVLAAAADMGVTEKNQPEWLWYEHEHGGICFGRWLRVNSAAPYIRADLVLTALSHLTPPKQDDARLAEYPFDTKPSDAAEDGGESKQDDARDSTVGAAVNACAVCGEHKSTPLRIDSLGGYVCLSCALASARADGVREASKAANEVHEYYAGVRDRTPTGTPAHDVAQECIIASARTWRAVAALLPDQPAAIRALINKDAGGPDAH